MAAETRVGFSFNNPDLTSDYFAPGFGMVVSSSDLRYDQLFGNKLVALSENQTITDDTLLEYIRVAIDYFEKELNMHILPRRIRYHDRRDKITGQVVEREDIKEEDAAYLSRMRPEQRNNLYIREPGYRFKKDRARHFGYIKLRWGPLRRVLKAELVDPYHNRTLVDLLPYIIEKEGLQKTIYFSPDMWAIALHQYGFDYGTIRFPVENFPEAFRIDYETGYANAADVPADLRGVISKTAAITLLDIYGDGKMAGLASKSVSLSSISESLSTTQSATSSTFGARRLQYSNDIKAWLKTHKTNYSGFTLGAL